jgi:hypothetical protein
MPHRVDPTVKRTSILQVLLLAIVVASIGIVVASIGKVEYPVPSRPYSITISQQRGTR